MHKDYKIEDYEIEECILNLSEGIGKGGEREDVAGSGWPAAPGRS
jgi:hypothetical protein